MTDISHIDLAVLRMEPGDILVVKVRGRVKLETAQMIKNEMRAAFARAGGDQHEVMVIDDAVDLQVIRRTS